MYTHVCIVVVNMFIMLWHTCGYQVNHHVSDVSTYLTVLRCKSLCPYVITRCNVTRRYASRACKWSVSRSEDVDANHAVKRRTRNVNS